MKIIILDFSDDTIYINNYIADNWESPEDYLGEHGFNSSNCQWMVTQKLKLEIE